MRILPHPLSGMAKTDPFQQGENLCVARLAAEPLMQANYFTYLIGNGFDRIERAAGILRNQADLRAA